MKPRFPFTAAALAIVLSAVPGCASTQDTDSAQREDLRNRVELAGKCMDIADYAASIFEQECIRALIEGRPPMEIAVLELDRNRVKATTRALALNPEPAYAIVDLYVWAQLAEWACGNRVRLNRALVPDDCTRTYGVVRQRIDHVAIKVIDQKRRAQVDAIVADFMEHNPDRLTIGTMRLQEILDNRKLGQVTVQDVAPTMFSPITDAARQLEQTRLLGMQLIWLAARMPTTVGEEFETSSRVVLESEGMKGTIGRIETVGNRLADATGSLAQVAASQAKVSNELAGVHQALTSIQTSVETLGGARDVANRALLWVAAIAAGTVVLATLGGLMVARAVRGGQGRSGNS